MRKPATCRVAAVVAVASIVLPSMFASAVARADDDSEPSLSELGAALTLAQQGVIAADAGKCDEAIDKLTRAERVTHSPVVAGRLAECKVAVGRVVEGIEGLERVMREPLPRTAPAAHYDAQTRARKVLAEALGKVATLRIAVGGTKSTVLVTIDGEPIPTNELRTRRRVDPGEHVIEAAAAGYRVARARVFLVAGDADAVALVLEPEQNGKEQEKGAVAMTTQRATTKVHAADDGSSPIPMYAAFAVGGIGVGVGTIAAIVAGNKSDDLEAQCLANTCPISVQDDVESLERVSNISTAGFITGAIGVATGVVLYLTSRPSTNAPAASALDATSNGLRIRF